MTYQSIRNIIIGLIFDEDKVKENLVFNKHSGELIGFLDIGEVNNQFVQFEEACKDTAKRKPVFQASWKTCIQNN